MLVCPRCSALFVRDVIRCGLDGERLVEVERDPLVGRHLDRYLIREVLGDGGMARVYRAEHVHLGQPVALKVLHGDMASDRRFAERFRREARCAAQIRHPQVVEVKDFGITEAGLNYMAMELLEGTTLADRMQRERRLDPATIADVIRQTAHGLSAAHGLGFVHRDLKPRNLMLVREAGSLRVKILDFGLVRLLESSDTRLTVHGQVFGTPAYMAPEQIVDGPIDARTDLYALGVILYELLAGHRPFAGEPGELLDKHVRAWPPELDDRSGLGALAQAMMSKAPSGRPTSALEVAWAIDALDLGPPRPAGPGGEETTPLRGRRRARPEARAERPAQEVSAGPVNAAALEEKAIKAIAAQARPAWPLRLLVVALLAGAVALIYPRYASQASSVEPVRELSEACVEPLRASPGAPPLSSPPKKAAPRDERPRGARAALLPRLPSGATRGPGPQREASPTEEEDLIDPDEPARSTPAPAAPPPTSSATISAPPPTAEAPLPVPAAQLTPARSSTVGGAATATASASLPARGDEAAQ